MNFQNDFIFDWLDFLIARYCHGKKPRNSVLSLGLLFEYQTFKTYLGKILLQKSIKIQILAQVWEIPFL